MVSSMERCRSRWWAARAAYLNAAKAFVLNATVVPSGSLGYLTLWPEGEAQPVVSTLNATDGSLTSNMAIVPTNNGSINAYATSDTQLLLDISSYFAPIGAVTVQTSSLPDGTLNNGYSVPLVAVGGVAPYTWTLVSGHLPPGMNPLSSTGVISGTPTSTGAYPFTVKATDSNTPSSSATANLNITVNGSASTLSVSTTSLPGGAVGTPYNALMAANGGITPYTWSVASGSLPVGLTLNPSSGLISGTPSAAGLTGFSVQVADSQHHTANQALSISVSTGDANGTLNGNYAFFLSGYHASNFGVIAGSFVADGNGNITSGEYDSNGMGGVVTATPFTGTYSIGANGLGTISGSGPDGSFELLIAVGSAENIRIINYNQNGSNGSWGSGVIRQQNPSDFNLPALAGNWAGGSQGFDPTHPIADNGSYQQDSAGNISNGAGDVNDFGTHGQYSFAGSTVGQIDSLGRVMEQLHINGQTVNFATYIVSANEVLLIEVDAGGKLITGTELRQSGTFNNGSMNGNSVGRGNREHHADSNPDPQALVLLLTADGNGNVSITEFTNTAGVIAEAHQPATYAVASNGRAVFTLQGATIVCYLVGSNQGYCINATASSGHDVAGAELIYFEPQSGGPFSNSSWSGEFLGGTIPVYLPTVFDQIDSNAIDGNGNFISTYTQSGPNGTQLNQTLTATYTIDGTGQIVISQGATQLYLGYLVSPTKAFLISADNNPRTSVEIQSQVGGPERHR